MLIFEKAWMPYFRREGHPVVTVQAFLDFVGDHLPQEPLLELPILTGEELYETAMATKSTAAGLDGWAWNEIKALSLSWFVGLALVLRQVEATGQWPQGLLDAYIAMIPKAEGLPLGRPLCVLPVVYRLWASVRLAHLKEWFYSWVPDSVFSAGKGVSSVDAWFATALDIEEVLSQTGHSDFHIFVADVLNILTLLIVIFLIVPLADLVSLPGFVRCTSLFIAMFVSVLSLLLVLGLLGSVMGAFPKVAL